MLSSNQRILLDEIISIKESNPQTELEARITKTISVEQFRRLAKTLKRAGYTRVEEPEVLDINFYSSERKDKNLSIRYTIVGLDNIRNYCKMERPIDHKSMYKSRIQWPQAVVDRYPDEKLSHSGVFINIDDFSYRINLKLEVVPDYDGNYSDKDAERVSNELNELIERVGYDNLFKTFRFKKRVSFLSLDENYRIDLTMIKNSKKTISISGNEDYLLTKSFKESNTLNEKELYEVEIEYVGKGDKTIANNLVLQMGFIHAVLFSKTNRSLSSRVQQKVMVEYTSLIKEMLINYTKIQKKELEELSRGVEDKDNKYNLQNNFSSRLENLSQDNLMKNNLYRSLSFKIQDLQELNSNDNKLFFVPKVISMGRENIQKGFGANILSNYTVTDKADGETMILYCSLSSNTAIYLIDTNMNVYPVIESDKAIGEWSSIAGSILVGEFVSKKKHINQTPDDDERTIPGFYTFDIYVHNKNDTRMLPLVSTNPAQRSRIEIANNVIQKINNMGSLNVEFAVKRFYHANSDIDNPDSKEIFRLTKEIWNKKDTPEFSYDLDGIIYTPADMPVGFDPSRWYWATQMSSRWVYNMKWKPAEENTIDFLVRIEKEEIEIDKDKNIYISRDKIRYKTIINNAKVDFVPYKTVHLYCGYKANNNGNPCIKTKDSKNTIKYVSTKFTPTSPSEPLAYIANIFLDENNNILGIKDKCRILDNTIVEFGYNIEKYASAGSDEERAELWIPLRTRIERTEAYEKALLDKERIFRVFEKYINGSWEKGYRWKTHETEELKMLKVIIDQFNLHDTPHPKNDSDPNYIYRVLTGFENRRILKSLIKNSLDIPVSISYGNDYEVANAIWNSIHNPITVKMITTGNDIPSYNDTEEVYYNRDSKVGRDKSITINLQKFHNKFVKDNELYTVATKMLVADGTKEIHLLDLACGKGGDLFKWNKNNISNVVGIDISSNNIYDPKDGACIRYTEFNKKMESYNITTPLKKVDFLYGDVSLNIKSGEAMKSEHSRQLGEELWQTYSTRGFDIISIQFALHYLFESENKLDGFLKNINENLRAGGLFIGTCFDGNKVYKLLKNVGLGNSIKGEEEGKVIYKIKKLYENMGDTLPSDSQSVGLPIEVYIQSINQSIKEYLVNYDYLVSKMAEIHLYPVKTLLFDEIYYANKEQLKELTDREKELSFLNRCFIFKKGESREIRVEDLYRNLMSIRANPDVNKALSHGLKQKNWDTLKELLKNLSMVVSAEEFSDLTAKLVKEKANISIEPLRKRKTLLQAVVSAELPAEEESVEAPESKELKKLEEPVKVVESKELKKVEEPIKVVQETPKPDLNREKFVKNFMNIEPKLMELRKGNYNQSALEAWLKHLEAVRGLYKPEYNMAGKVKELDITIDVIKGKLKTKK